MKISAKLVVLGVLFGLVACGGEGGRRIGGNRCPAAFNPVPMTIKDPSLKINAKGTDFSNLPAGTYKYSGAQLYYVDRATGAKILLSDVRKGAKDSTDFNPKISCVRGYTKLSKGGSLNVSASGVSDLQIDENHKMVNFEVKDYAFMFKNGKRVDQFKKADSKPGSFKEVYDKTADEAFLIKISATRYQIRSFYPGAKDRGDVYLLISLDYSAPAP